MAPTVAVTMTPSPAHPSLSQSSMVVVPRPGAWLPTSSAEDKFGRTAVWEPVDSSGPLVLGDALDGRVVETGDGSVVGTGDVAGVLVSFVRCVCWVGTGSLGKSSLLMSMRANTKRSEGMQR